MGERKTTRKDGSRFYTFNEKKYWSVTTILNALAKQRALTPWAAKMVAEAVVVHDRDAVLRELGKIDGMEESDQFSAQTDLINKLKRAPYKKRDKAADIGSKFHDFAERLSLGQEIGTPDLDVRAHVEAFQKWLEQARPDFEAVELVVFNEHFEYAGTLDAIVKLPGKEGYGVVDYKTSAKGPYPDVALQLAAYRAAQFGVLKDDTVVKLPEPITWGAVLKVVPPEPAQLIEVECGERVLDVFLAVQTMYHEWFGDLEKSVLGEELAA